MRGYNKAIIAGNLGRDPEIRSLNNGDKVASFSVAMNEQWKDKQTGEKKEFTEWMNVVIFNQGLVGVVEKFVKKGSGVLVEGKLKTRKWDDQNGVTRYTTEIVLSTFDGNLLLLDSGSGGSTKPPQPDETSYGGRVAGPSDPSGASRSSNAARRELDDEIPF